MTNREIDALVAEKVKSLPPCQDHAGAGFGRLCFLVADDGKNNRACIICPCYSTDPAASDELLDYMAKLGWSWQANFMAAQKRFYWTFIDNNGNIGIADSASKQQAIALAALDAFHVEVPA